MISTLCRIKKLTPIGLDIGDAGTRAVQMIRSDDAYSVVNSARVHHPGPGSEERSDADVAHQVRACVTQAEFKGRNVVTALNLPDLEFHALELPKATPEELDRAVHWEMERLVSGAEGTVESQYWPLPPAPATGPNAIGVGARREVILQSMAACEQGGVVCSCVDAAATALCRFGLLINKWDSDSIWGILDLGSRQSRLILCMDEVVVLTRTVSDGGAAWTQLIAEALNTSLKSAEVHKRNHGVALSGRNAANPADRTPRSELSSILLGILRSDLNDLAAEIKRSYEYVLSCYSARRPGALLLVGGGAAMSNLPCYLTDALGIAVQPASSFLEEKSCRLGYASARQDPLELFALAIGLAIED